VTKRCLFHVGFSPVVIVNLSVLRPMNDGPVFGASFRRATVKTGRCISFSVVYHVLYFAIPVDGVKREPFDCVTPSFAGALVI